MAGFPRAWHAGPISGHFDGERFFDPVNPRRRDFRAFLRWRLKGSRGHWPEPGTLRPPGLHEPVPCMEGTGLRVTYVGHATVLLQTQGLNILTDPVWSERASPFSWLGPRRRQAPGLAFASLPAVDLVFVSHNHYDHMDLPTLRALQERDRPLVVTPLGNDALLRRAVPGLRVEALDWDGSLEVASGVRLHVLHAQHWSARGMFDTNRALWGALAIELPGGNVYAALDTGFADGEPFRQARRRFGPFRFALLPIGACEPRWFMEYAHMNPEEAVEAALILGAEQALAVHYDVFPLADDGFGLARQRLIAARRERGLAADRLRDLEVGGVWEVPPLARQEASATASASPRSRR